MVREFLRAFRSRLDDQRVIGQLNEQIVRLNSTIDNLLRKHSEHHSQHVESHESQIEMRELEMQREFDAILNMRDREIEQIKFKYKNFWQVYEDLMERHTDLEKLRVGIAAKMGLVQGYDRESIKCMKIVIEEIDVFNRKIESLECRANKLIPER